MQDVGVRYYTFVWCMWDVLVACAHLHLPMVRVFSLRVVEVAE